MKTKIWKLGLKALLLIMLHTLIRFDAEDTWFYMLLELFQYWSIKLLPTVLLAMKHFTKINSLQLTMARNSIKSGILRIHIYVYSHTLKLTVIHVVGSDTGIESMAEYFRIKASVEDPQIIRAYSHQLRELLVACSFNGAECDRTYVQQGLHTRPYKSHGRYIIDLSVCPTHRWI